MFHSLITDIVDVPVSAITPHPRNPRRGSVELIKASLMANGQFKPLVVQTDTGYVLAGNHTLKAARELKWETVSVVYVDVDDDRAMKILLADNRTGDNSTYDDAALLELLHGLNGDFVGTGYTIDDQEDLAYLLQGIAEVAVPVTDAHFNETDEEMEQRQARLDNYSTMASRGVAEMVLIVKAEQKEEMFGWFEDLRSRWGAELTNGDIAHEAIRRAAQA